MSGGHFDYMFEKIKDMYEGAMLDDELNAMLLDFCKLLHDLEWYESCDYGEDEYRRTVERFKACWFNRTSTTSQESYSTGYKEGYTAALLGVKQGVEEPLKYLTGGTDYNFEPTEDGIKVMQVGKPTITPASTAE